MYIDPAAGSTIIQIGAAVLVSTLAMADRVRASVWTIISTVFTRRSR